MNDEGKRYSSDQLFMAACAANNPEEIRRLLNNGLDVNIRDRTGATALFHCNCSAVARLLLTQGADLTLTNHRAETALHIAAAKGNKEMALFLILNGADVAATDMEGKTPEATNESLRPLIYAVNKDKGTYASLSDLQKKKLLGIFAQVDVEGLGFWNLDKSAKVNRFIENVNEEVARRDAQDFLRDVSICTKGTVNPEEWLFAFAKLAAEQGAAAVDTFVEEFERALRDQGQFDEFTPGRRD